MALYKKPENMVIRGFLTKAYPTPEQIEALEAMQPSLRTAWNWLTGLWPNHVRRCEAWAISQGIVEPLPPKPEYVGLASEEAKALKEERRKFLQARKAKYMAAAKASDGAPQFLPFSAAADKPSIKARCLSEGYIKGKGHDYQLLNFVLAERGHKKLDASYLQALYKQFRQPSDYPKKARRDHETLPMSFKTGGSFRLEEGRWGSIKFPGIPGRLRLRVDDGIRPKLSRVVEGATLRYEHGTWWLSLKRYQPMKETEKHGLRKASKDAKAQEVLLDSGNGPGSNSVLGIDPGLDNLISDSAGNQLRNPRNKAFQDAKDLAKSVIDGILAPAKGEAKPAEETANELRDMLSAVHRQDARARRRVIESIRQYAAKVDRLFDVVKIEKNSGLALGIGQSTYQGATRTILQILRQRLGWDRVREVESFYNSQRCSQCGPGSQPDKKTWERRLGQKDQTCTCPKCGYTADRDLNAARNVAAREPIPLYI